MKRWIMSLLAAGLLCGAGCVKVDCEVSIPRLLPVPEAEAKTNIEKVCSFLKAAKVYYIATLDQENQPRVRPFGTVNIYNGKLYIQTGRKKNVAKQILANPKVELCAFNGKQWLRLSGTLTEDPSIDAQKSMLAAYPSLGKMYQPGDGNNMVLYFKDATATIQAFGPDGGKETLRF